MTLGRWLYNSLHSRIINAKDGILAPNTPTPVSLNSMHLAEGKTCMVAAFNQISISRTTRSVVEAFSRHIFSLVIYVTRGKLNMLVVSIRCLINMTASTSRTSLIKALAHKRSAYRTLIRRRSANRVSNLRALIRRALTSRASTSKASASRTSTSRASISKASVGKASISKTSISKQQGFNHYAFNQQLADDERVIIEISTDDNIVNQRHAKENPTDERHVNEETFGVGRPIGAHKHVMRSNIWPTHPQNKFSIPPPLFLLLLTTNQTHIAPSLPLPCHNQLNNPVKAQDFTKNSWDPSITHITLLPSPLQLLMPALML